MASAEGLTGLSFGRLAAGLGLSKAGIQTLFRTKENLQVATVGSAGEQFARERPPVSGAAPDGDRLTTGGLHVHQ